jgi:predicted metal-dependent RNase
MTLLQLDYLDVANKQGSMAPYSQKDVRDTVMHTIPLRYGAVTDIAPDIRLTLHNSGHILGSSIVHLHIGEGLHNLVYTGDYKYGKSMLLEPAVSTFPRVETIITESQTDRRGIMPPGRIRGKTYSNNQRNIGQARQSFDSCSRSWSRPRNHVDNRRLHASGSA